MGTSVCQEDISTIQSSTMKVFAALLGLALVLNASNGVSAACSRADEAADLIQKEAGDADPDAICAAAKKMSMDEVMDKLEGYADEQGWSDKDVAEAAMDTLNADDQKEVAVALTGNDDAEADDVVDGVESGAITKEQVIAAAKEVRGEADDDADADDDANGADALAALRANCPDALDDDVPDCDTGDDDDGDADEVEADSNEA